MWRAILLMGVAWMAMVGSVALAADEEYIKVEIRGKIESGIMAIGGETTGTLIRAGNVTWELDLGKDAKLNAEAAKLNGKTAIVTGTYTQKEGVEIPTRHIVKVTSVKVPEAK